jgi:hypothetical protein
MIMPSVHGTMSIPRRRIRRSATMIIPVEFLRDAILYSAVFSEREAEDIKVEFAGEHKEEDREYALAQDIEDGVEDLF